MKRREKEREEEVDAGRRGGGGSDKYIFVLCSVVADGFSFNVSCEERRLEDFFFSLLSTRSDCHQFASWHLNQAFQTGVFEMQMRWHATCKIKRHASERDTFKDMTVYGTHLLSVKQLGLFLSVLCRKKVKSERSRVFSSVFFFCLSHPWLPCLRLEGCVRLGSSFSPQTHGENMIHIFPPSLHLSDATVI